MRESVSQMSWNVAVKEEPVDNIRSLFTSNQFSQSVSDACLFAVSSLLSTPLGLARFAARSSHVVLVLDCRDSGSSDGEPGLTEAINQVSRCIVNKI